MATEDELLQAAIVDQVNAERAGMGWSVKDLAGLMGRPYDSTRNYLSKDRPMPLDFLLQAARVLGVPADVVVSRARNQQLEKYLKSDS